jgi:hypothetical protein
MDAALTLLARLPNEASVHFGPQVLIQGSHLHEWFYRSSGFFLAMTRSRGSSVSCGEKELSRLRTRLVRPHRSASGKQLNIFSATSPSHLWFLSFGFQKSAEKNRKHISYSVELAGMPCGPRVSKLALNRLLESKPARCPRRPYHSPERFKAAEASQVQDCERTSV